MKVLGADSTTRLRAAQTGARIFWSAHPHPSAAQTKRPARAAGFTLIEMLVVMAVIAILASLIFPVTRAVNRTKIKSRTRAEMEQIITAIETYKDKRGYYPPDNVLNPATKVVNAYTNQLYYELVGTTLSNNVYWTSDGRSQLPTNSFAAFGGVSGVSGVSGFVNTMIGSGGGDEGSTMVKCFKTGLSANQVGDVAGIKVLVGSVPLPVNQVGAAYPGMASINSTPGYCSWRYVSSNPTNNPTSYDLWIDIVVDGKTNRFNNWSRDAIIVGAP